MHLKNRGVSTTLRSFSVCGVVLWTTVGFALDTKDIVRAVETIYAEQCSQVHEHDLEAQEDCKILKERMGLFEDPHAVTFLNELTGQMGAEMCPTEARAIAKNWVSASKKLHLFEPASVLGAIICIQKHRPEWIAKCKHSTSSALGPFESPCQVVSSEGNDFSIRKIEIKLKKDCDSTFFTIEGKENEGYFKTAHRQFEYSNWRDRIQLRFKKKISQLNREELLEVINELAILHRMQNHHYIGFADVLDVGPEAIELEAFEGQLGIAAGNITGFATGGWQQGASQVLAALSLFHELGFRHKDIKPENMLVSSRQRSWPPPKMALSDFGLSEDLSSLCEKGLPIPLPHVKKGTPLTSPPEAFLLFNFKGWPEGKCEEHAEIAKKADVFSTGLVLYKMKTGKEIPWINDPGCRDTTKTFIDCLKNKLPGFISDLAKSPDKMNQLLARAMDPEITKRPSSREFQLEFDELIKESIHTQLKNDLPLLRRDIHEENWQEALKNQPKGKYITYLETSPTEGIFQINAAYIDPKSGQGVKTRIEANPFNPAQVVQKISEFEKIHRYSPTSGAELAKNQGWPKLQSGPKKEPLPEFLANIPLPPAALFPLAEDDGRLDFSSGKNATLKVKAAPLASLDHESAIKILAQDQFPEGAYLFWASPADQSGAKTYFVSYKKNSEIKLVNLGSDQDKANQMLQLRRNDFKHKVVNEEFLYKVDLSSSLVPVLSGKADPESVLGSDTIPFGGYLIVPLPSFSQSNQPNFLLYYKTPYGNISTEKLFSKPGDTAALKDEIKKYSEEATHPVFTTPGDFHLEHSFVEESRSH